MRGHLLALIPLSNVGINLGLDPLADFLTESSVGFVKVRRRVLSYANISTSPTFSEGLTYTLVPRRIGEGDQVAIGILRLGSRRGLEIARGLRLRRGLGLLRGRGRGRSGLGLLLGIQRADLELALVLLQDTLVVVLPELLGGILSGNALENCVTC